MKRLFVTGLLLAGILITGNWVASSAAQPNPQAVKAFMRGKLDSSQNVLEGLVTEDFEKIVRGAERMQVMSMKARWNVYQTPDYQQYTGEFQSAAQKLVKAGKEKKIDSAALAYVQLTMTCVNCHKHVRNQAVAQLPRELSVTPASLAKDGGNTPQSKTRLVKFARNRQNDQDQKKEAILKKFMRAKLKHSNKVLEGLTVEDFGLISQGAKRLGKMSKSEQWRVSNDAMYRQHSAQYQRVVDQLQRAAQEKKLDSAALAWTQTTLSCIECHKWVRNVLISDK